MRGKEGPTAFLARASRLVESVLWEGARCGQRSLDPGSLARMSRCWQTMVAVGVGVVLVLLLVRYVPPADPSTTPPITVRLSGATNASGARGVTATFTNTSGFYYIISYSSETWKQGRWVPGGLYRSTMRNARDLRPHGTLSFALAVEGSGAGVCRIKVDAGRVPTGVEGSVYYFLERRVGRRMPWPLLQPFSVFSPPFAVEK